ncbi:MAG: PD-(D/E)XK nuclease family protein [Terracidiphilus sp.]|nr:PD-(D/E)XK nuclease family protein [Terracidiphilus sp.]MDR3775639.1 PD-(D/E)XK nuclease family protein [Terracidiphilus sp.]
MEIDTWLEDGGLVVTASDRAARALTAAFHRARRAEGLTAWPAPKIQDWKSFLRSAWEERTQDGRLLLNPAQEQALWSAIAANSRHMATLLEGPRHRLAALAVEAHELLCSFAPQFLASASRSGWQQDPRGFSDWLTAFDETCRSGNLLSPSRLPLELLPLLEDAAQPKRPPLLLAGFDRILPTQLALLNAWGAWQQLASAEPAAQVRFYETESAEAELTACAIWCSRQLTGNPQARLLIITQDAVKRRGEIERTFLQYASLPHSAAAPLFEFSLGIPLGQVALARGASLLLRWLDGALSESELDWLLSTGQAAASPEESAALLATMRALRQRNLERTHWTLEAFLNQSPASLLPVPWSQRMIEAQRALKAIHSRTQTPLDWAALVPQLLASTGWPGARPLSSAEFQAADRWQKAVETCGSLGFDGRPTSWQDFLSALAHTLDETLFAPQSREAPILIAGPAESAGLAADAVWFLGADEDHWPPKGATHPLLPPELQRDSSMPHGTAQLDWELARAITTRLLATAPDVTFSFARQSEGAEARPSRLVATLIAQLSGPPQPLPAEYAPPASPPQLAVPFEDASRIPFPPGKAEGGSNVLTNQSQCPFKAFATARLAAKSWDPAQAGLTAAQRGSLLHAVLHAIWSGPPDGIRTLAELKNLADRKAFVAAHVQRVLQAELRPSLRSRMPHRYLELEELRLTALVAEWLDYEATRIDFEVVGTEVDRTIHLAGLTLNLRLDRIDRLTDQTLLVVDYKTGDVSPKSWDLPRPDDVQLPLYAAFALNPEEEVLGGLVFAKVRAGDRSFAGRVCAPNSTLFEGLRGNNTLMKTTLTVEQLIDWKENIEQLAKDFVTGRAEVDPRDYPKTCEYCGLQTLCRIQENQAIAADEDSEEAADE